MTDKSQRSTRRLDLEDMLSDTLDGFAMWRDSKISSATLDERDEQFIRWIEAGPTRRDAE